MDGITQFVTIFVVSLILPDSMSWEWFYPYFYAPLFSDLVNLSSYTIQFKLGTPFTPYQQLLGILVLIFFHCVNDSLGVLPAASARFLPAPYQFLMTNPVSPIIDFYPEDFKIGILIVHMQE
jgi:5'-3' exonuclease